MFTSTYNTVTLTSNPPPKLAPFFSHLLSFAQEAVKDLTASQQVVLSYCGLTREVTVSLKGSTPSPSGQCLNLVVSTIRSSNTLPDFNSYLKNLGGGG